VAAQLGVAKFAGLADGERMLSLTKTPNWTRWAAAVRRCGWAVAVWLALGSAVAADSRPVVGPGATKEEVLDAYGWPTGLSQAGAKEILIYPQGRVVLDKGRVEVVDFTLKTPWPAPRPRPGGNGRGGDADGGGARGVLVYELARGGEGGAAAARAHFDGVRRVGLVAAEPAVFDGGGGGAGIPDGVSREFCVGKIGFSNAGDAAKGVA
jgi:hypothetical protein